MNFITFKQAVAKQFDMMAKHDLFTTKVEKDDVWATYLGSFPEGSNPIYKTRTEHDCTCCKQFIRAVGNVVAIIDGKLVSIWDVTADDPNYQIVTNALSALVKSQPIDNAFLHFERTAGTDKNLQDTLDGIKTWNHFFVNIPAVYVSKDIGPKLGELRATHDVMLRSLREIKNEAVETVLELIEQNSLYRGAEHKFAVAEFQKLRCQSAASTNIDQFVWSNIKSVPPSVSRIRNTSIGTLLVALSEGVELDKAVASFEAMVAPQNYKRPTALVTKAMIESAKNKIEELGLVSALERRYATIADITINNILFANRDAKKAIQGDVFDTLITKSEKPKLDKVEDVTIDQFIANILPKAESIEIMMDNKHTGNLVSLIAPVDPTALNMFKWDNKFSWSYNGEMADSIKERVKQAGGNVTGDLCCRLAWDYSDDLDFYMYEPDGNIVYFGNRGRKSKNGGMLDVDANGMDGIRKEPVENIFYNRIADMEPGTYKLRVKNYHRRSNGVGFEVEVDIMGVVHRFSHEKVVTTKDNILVADIVRKKDGTIEVVPHLSSSQSVREVWGVSTNTFQKVNVMMMSPNFWDGHGVGNKHYFFMLDACLNDGKARGFFNEFLKPDLDAHRKVIEMVGSKMKTDESSQQLSGLGFSSTQRNSLLCRVKGSFTRTINILF
jgi:hypothetical protein